MKPTLKSKTEELLKQKEKQLAKTTKEHERLKGVLKIERRSSKDIISFKEIKITMEIASLFGSQQELMQFTTDLKVLLNWAE